jgi:hypothetical protein
LGDGQGQDPGHAQKTLVHIRDETKSPLPGNLKSKVLPKRGLVRLNKEMSRDSIYTAETRPHLQYNGSFFDELNSGFGSYAKLQSCCFEVAATATVLARAAARENSSKSL